RHGTGPAVAIQPPAAPSAHAAEPSRPHHDSAPPPIAVEGENSGSTSLKDVVRAQTSRGERELIARALDETGGNGTQAAQVLKISRKSLQMKMKEFGLRDREAGP